MHEIFVFWMYLILDADAMEDFLLVTMLNGGK